MGLSPAGPQLSTTHGLPVSVHLLGVYLLPSDSGLAPHQRGNVDQKVYGARLLWQHAGYRVSTMR